MRKQKELDPNLKPEELARQAYAKAIRLLGAREHTTTEIRKKLGDTGFDNDVIEATLEQLISSGYQSDERFATLYAEQLLRKHYGPMAIRAKLTARGIDSSQASDAIAKLAVDWSEIATDALRSRFSSHFVSIAVDNKAVENESWDDEALDNEDRFTQNSQADVGKFARFLNRRGFSSTDSIKAIRLAAETVTD